MALIKEYRVSLPGVMRYYYFIAKDKAEAIKRLRGRSRYYGYYVPSSFTVILWRTGRQVGSLKLTSEAKRIQKKYKQFRKELYKGQQEDNAIVKNFVRTLNEKRSTR